MKFRLFGSRNPRKPAHKPTRRVDRDAVSPDTSAPTYRPPTIHSARLEAEYARLKRQERYNFYLRQLHRELGEDVRNVMSQPLHLDDGQHDAPTLADSHKTDKIPELHEED